MNRIKTIIVDDEKLAVEKIRRELRNDKEILVVGEYYDGVSAVNGIQESKPELLFLDVQMPELDGFGVIKALDNNELPVIVFVTAYDKYAVQAFEYHALDYLLKPFDSARFETSLKRAKQSIHQKYQGETLQQQLKQLIENMSQETAFLERLIVRTKGRIFFLDVSEIDWIEAAGNYVKLHTATENHLIRSTMKSMAEKLDPKDFIRIHKSSIVRLDKIKHIQPWFNGEYIVTLYNNEKLTLSRSYRKNFKDLL
jgi:two-component system, LytTR family, response regulator